MKRNLNELGTIQTVLSSWLDPDQDRHLFENIPRMSSVLEKLDSLSLDVARLLGEEAGEPGELGRLNEESEKLANAFSRKLKRIIDVLSAISEISAEAIRDELRQIRDDLFPHDIVTGFDDSVQRVSFVILTEMRLSLRMRALLEGISYGERTLFDDYNDWVLTGKALGAVEEERLRITLKATCIADENALNQARSRWCGLVKSVIDLLDDESSVDEQTRRRILFPLRQAEARLGTILLKYEEGGDLDDKGAAF